MLTYFQFGEEKRIKTFKTQTFPFRKFPQTVGARFSSEPDLLRVRAQHSFNHVDNERGFVESEIPRIWAESVAGAIELLLRSTQ